MTRWKIKHNDGGYPVAIVEVSPAGAECSYAQGTEEFEKILKICGLDFKPIDPPLKSAPVAEPRITEAELAWLRSKMALESERK